MENSCASLLAELEKATQGLRFISETDAPFQIIFWPEAAKQPLTVERLLALTKHPQDKVVEIIDLDEFFEVATRDQDWHRESEQADVKRYRALAKLLKDRLSNLQVYRVGQIEIDVYIVGATPNGDLAGLATKVNET
jgi:hypothetical protein